MTAVESIFLKTTKSVLKKILAAVKRKVTGDIKLKRRMIALRFQGLQKHMLLFEKRKYVKRFGSKTE